MKYLLSGLKLSLRRTTHLHSSTNILKCAATYDCYEYGSETQANHWQTRHKTCWNVSFFLPANHKARKKKEAAHLCVRCTRFFFVTIDLVLLIYHAITNKLKLLLTNWNQNEFIVWRASRVNIQTTLMWYTSIAFLLILVLLPIVIFRPWKPLIAAKV